MFSQAITITLNYVINIPNAFIVFQLQPIVKFLMYNTNIFVHLEIYHNETLCNKGNIACLKLCQLSFVVDVSSLASVASVSIWFRSKERPVLAAREMKWEPPLRSFTCALFRAVFSSFFTPKQHGNACYAGYQFKANIKVKSPRFGIIMTPFSRQNE